MPRKIRTIRQFSEAYTTTIDYAGHDPATVYNWLKHVMRASP